MRLPGLSSTGLARLPWGYEKTTGGNLAGHSGTLSHLYLAHLTAQSRLPLVFSILACCFFIGTAPQLSHLLQLLLHTFISLLTLQGYPTSTYLQPPGAIWQVHVWVELNQKKEMCSKARRKIDVPQGTLWLPDRTMQVLHSGS